MAHKPSPIVQQNISMSSQEVTIQKLVDKMDEQEAVNQQMVAKINDQGTKIDMLENQIALQGANCKGDQSKGVMPSPDLRGLKCWFLKYL